MTYRIIFKNGTTGDYPEAFIMDLASKLDGSLRHIEGKYYGIDPSEILTIFPLQ